MRAKWVVEIKGNPNQSAEISVLRDDNEHGKRSYGWEGDTKIIVAGHGGPCSYTYSKFLFDRHVETAELYAEYLNSLEVTP